VLDALDELLGNVADAVMPLRFVGLGGRGCLAIQQASSQLRQIAYEPLHPQ
jgi:hypothetical protein